MTQLKGFSTKELDQLREGLPGPLFYQHTVDSTQTQLAARARLGAPDLSVMLADLQHEGRGRLGRSWRAPAGENLTVSLLLRTPLKPEVAPLVTLAASVALAQTIGLGTGIKWPNDLLAIDGRKLAGIVANREPMGRWITLGIGVNLSWAPPELPASCLADWGPPVSRSALLLRLVGAVSEQVRRLAYDPSLVLADWSDRSCTLGRRVRVGEVEGVATGLHSSGALLIETPSGVVKRVSGDVFFCTDSGGNAISG